MRTHISADRVGAPGADHWVEVGVVPVSSTGFHWSARASTSTEAAPAGRLELRGQAGKTVLWEAGLTLAAQMIALPVTLPGERLVFLAQTQKKARFTLELAWIEPGEITPTPRGTPCPV